MVKIAFKYNYTLNYNYNHKKNYERIFLTIIKYKKYEHIIEILEMNFPFNFTFTPCRKDMNCFTPSRNFIK
ncbi:hypothetical protein YN1HA_19660 [Sulfurisphaera ohwakuensis]